VFSLVRNPEAAITFFNDAAKLLAAGINVRMDFSEVDELTPDAIAMLVASLKDKKFMRDMSVVGNGPTKPEPRRIWYESGFHSQVHSQLRVADTKGRFERRDAVQVNPPAAKQLIRFATTKIYGSPKKWQTVQRTLVECMTNTRTHAAGTKFSKRTWWAFVHADDVYRRAYFAFVDRGIGIFHSPLLTRRRSVLRALGLVSNTDIMRGLLKGEVPSSTGRKNRGKGFPHMYQDVIAPDRDNIRGLVIIANDVFADVERDSFRTINPPFPGTFLYWEKS
jgi:hypothetical protein